MTKTIKESVEEIKKLEQKVVKDSEDSDSLKKLGVAFKSLAKLKDGPLSYLDVTTTEEIIHLYDVDTEDYFEELQRKGTELKGASNPGNYAWIHSDIRLVVIERTKKNEEIAKSVVKEIVSALKERT